MKMHTSNPGPFLRTYLGPLFISMKIHCILFIIIFALHSIVVHAQDLGDNLKVIYAINAGGYDHIDKNGIHYDADPLNVGTASDYGNHLLLIGRVPEQDEVLYRTERYHTSNFGYNIPVSGDGKYALVLKFCEVYFNKENMKIFDVLLNHQHVVVSQLDIFAQVGRGTAHDEYVYFTVVNGKLHYNDEISEIRNNIIRLEFLKGNYDNPKINAFVLFKGEVQRVPRLKPFSNEGIHKKKNMGDRIGEKHLRETRKSRQHSVSQGYSNKNEADDYEDEDDEDDEDDNETTFDDEDNNNDEFLTRKRHEKKDSINDNSNIKYIEEDDFDDDDFRELTITNKKKRKISGPRHPNPYKMMDESSMLMPIIVAIGTFIPLLFCLCKL